MSWIGGDGVPGRKERRAKNNPLNYPIPRPSPLPWISEALKARRSLIKGIEDLEAICKGMDEVTLMILNEVAADTERISSSLQHLKSIYKAKEDGDEA